MQKIRLSTYLTLLTIFFPLLLSAFLFSFVLGLWGIGPFLGGSGYPIAAKLLLTGLFLWFIRLLFRVSCNHPLVWLTSNEVVVVGLSGKRCIPLSQIEEVIQTHRYGRGGNFYIHIGLKSDSSFGNEIRFAPPLKLYLHELHPTTRILKEALPQVKFRRIQGQREDSV